MDGEGQHALCQTLERAPPAHPPHSRAPPLHSYLASLGFESRYLFSNLKSGGPSSLFCRLRSPIVFWLTLCMFRLHETGHADAGAVQAVQHWLWGVLEEQRGRGKALLFLRVQL